MTLVEVAYVLGVTKQRVLQLEAEALVKMRLRLRALGVTQPGRSWDRQGAWDAMELEA